MVPKKCQAFLNQAAANPALPEILLDEERRDVPECGSQRKDTDWYTACNGLKKSDWFPIGFRDKGALRPEIGIEQEESPKLFDRDGILGETVVPHSDDRLQVAGLKRAEPNLVRMRDRHE